MAPELRLPQRVRMEAGRIGVGEVGSREQKRLRQQGIRSPLSRFPSGESRGGRVPPTPQKARLPPQEGSAPL